VAIVKIWGLLLRLLLHGEDSVGSSSTYRLLLIVLLGWLEDAMKSEWKLDAFSSPWIEKSAMRRGNFLLDGCFRSFRQSCASSFFCPSSTWLDRFVDVRTRTTGGRLALKRGGLIDISMVYHRYNLVP
jgi:hypothetical protein